VTPIPREQAARAFVACGPDPEGIATPESAAASGECFRLDTDTGSLMFALSFEDRVGWIHAAAGTGCGMTAAGLEAIERKARAEGCRLVGFQTLRRGLVRRARKHGYRITRQVGAGFILEKALT
jgi:hypothetical protein